MFAVLVAVLVAQAAPEAHPFSPELQAPYDQAFEAIRKGDHPRAAELIDQVLQGAPENPRSWQAKGFLAAQRDHDEEAVAAFTRALELGLDAKRRPTILALRAQSRISVAAKAHPGEKKERLAEAEADLQEAQRAEPEAVAVLQAASSLAYEKQDLAGALRYAERLAEVGPDEPSAWVRLAALRGSTGDLENAEKAMERAESLGASAPFFTELSELAFNARWFRRAWQWPLFSLAFLAVALIGFFLAGAALSRLQLGKLETGAMALMKDEQSDEERRAGRLYDAVLWLGSALFYISVPAMLLVTVALAGWMVYGLLMMGRVPIKLLLIALLIGAGGVWAVVRGLFVGGPTDEGGRVLTEAEEPKLFAVLREVSEVARSRMVDRVHLETDVSVGVREAGSMWSVLTGRGKRVLHLGYGALSALSVEELKSVLAHEYGHFSHGETRLNPVINRITGSAITTFSALAGDLTFKVNPVFWYLRLYITAYLKVTAAHGRRRELLADRAAAKAYGGATFGRALSKVVSSGIDFERLAATVVVTMRRAGRPVANLYSCLGTAAQASPEWLKQERVNEAVNREQGAYDSHPPPHERIARVAEVVGTHPAEPGPATDLLTDPSATAATLTAEIVGRIDQALVNEGIDAAPPKELELARQLQMSAAIALHSDAAELNEKGDARGVELLTTALKRAEEAVGADDPLLVPALVDLSQVQIQKGDRSLGVSAMARAVGIAQKSHGETHPMALELQSRLRQLHELPPT